MGNITEEITEEIMGKEVMVDMEVMGVTMLNTDTDMVITETRDTTLSTVSTMIPAMVGETATVRRELGREALTSWRTEERLVRRDRRPRTRQGAPGW